MDENQSEIERLRYENNTMRAYCDALHGEINAMRADMLKVKSTAVSLNLIRRHDARKAEIRRPPFLS